MGNFVFSSLSIFDTLLLLCVVLLALYKEQYRGSINEPTLGYVYMSYLKPQETNQDLLFCKMTTDNFSELFKRGGWGEAEYNYK